jgi:hypothetical protein
MKKLLIIIMILILFGTIGSGCAAQASSSDVVSALPSSSASASLTPSVSLTPIPTTPPDVTPEAVSAGDAEDEDTKSVTLNGNVYYLDIKDPVAADYNEDPPLHVKKTDGSGDNGLGIRGFQFNIIGNYIYIDSNDPDLSAAGTQTWSTFRVKLDGSEKRELEYGCMSRFIPQGEQKFYFTTLGDSALYVSDLSCENVTVLTVDLPNKNTLGKLDTNKILQIDITGVASGVINFDAVYLSTNGTMLYSGSYTINVDGTNIALVKNTDKVYNYVPQND